MIDQTRLATIMHEAAVIAMAAWPGAGHQVESWHKRPGELVCAADLAVDVFLKRELGGLLPDAGWLSEETADAPARLENKLAWVVDPIDGTRDFLRGRTGWAISVALVSAGQPLIAMLAAPARGDGASAVNEHGDAGPNGIAGEMWTAQAGCGAFRDGARLTASDRGELTGARVPIDTLPRQDRDLVAVAKPNSIALRMAMVAAGEADLLATQRWGFEWDVAAATLIAREAGGGDKRCAGPAASVQQTRPARLWLAGERPGDPCRRRRALRFPCGIGSAQRAIAPAIAARCMVGRTAFARS